MIIGTIEIFESYIPRGAPLNASGAKVGYGLTKEEAHANAQHWANQAPWAKARRVTVSDESGPPPLTSRDEEIAWAVCGVPGEFVPATAAELECAALIRRGLHATAIRMALSRR